MKWRSRPPKARPVPQPSDNWAFVEDPPPTWIPLIPDFTGTPWPDRAAYAGWAAQNVALALGSALAPEQREERTTALAETIRDAYEALFGKVLAHQFFLHVPSLEHPPLPVFLGIWKSAGDREEMLDYFTGVDDPAAVAEPVAVDFTTERLGTGRRVYHVAKQSEGELMATLAYAFRVDEYATDIRLHTISYDLGLLQESVPLIDEFVHRVVPTPDPGAADG